jgi:hypothetical protein
MGLGIVLLAWAFIGLILASGAAGSFAGAVAYLTRRAATDRRSLILAAGLFPFVCFAWAGVVFVFQATVNEGVLNRDPGMGDTWHAPLPNGDQIMMIDVTNEGWVYNPKTQGAGGGVGEKEDAVPGVKLLQVAGPYVLGGKQDGAIPDFSGDTSHVDSYFLLDTGTGKRTRFATYGELRTAAQKLQIEPKLEPIYAVYSRYRFTWFDVLAGLLFVVPVLVGFARLVLRVKRLRRNVLPTEARAM